MSNDEIILEVGAAGGCVQLRGEHLSDDTWRFLMKRNESMVFDMLSDDEKDGLQATEHSDRVNTFDEAIRLCDRYPWHMLFPVTVHPEFRDRIYGIVAERLASEDPESRRHLAKWGSLCGVPGDGHEPL